VFAPSHQNLSSGPAPGPYQRPTVHIYMSTCTVRMHADRPSSSTSVDRSGIPIHCVAHTHTHARTYVRTHAARLRLRSSLPCKRSHSRSVHRITVHVIRLQSCSVPAGKSLYMVLLWFARLIAACMQACMALHTPHVCLGPRSLLRACMQPRRHVVVLTDRALYYIRASLGRKVPVRFVSCDRRSL
jgi:hypothetical protein